MGISVCMGHSMCVRLHVHVGMTRYEPPYLYMGGYVTDRLQSEHYIRYRRLGLALSVCI